MTEEKLYDHDVSENDQLVAEFEKGTEKADVYYVYCVDEDKRIGGYSGDLTVINNRASYHSRTHGHNTRVYKK